MSEVKDPQCLGPAASGYVSEPKHKVCVSLVVSEPSTKHTQYRMLGRVRVRVRVEMLGNE